MNDLSPQIQSIKHGSFSQDTRHQIVQHDYAGGSDESGWGYIEVLEIKDPPYGCCGIVINECMSHKGSVFTEWDTVENARAAFKKSWNPGFTEKIYPTLPGFKRRVVCGELVPWFYEMSY